MNQWEFLKNRFEAGKLGHAYILSGRDFEGLKKFTDDFVKLIGCNFPDALTIKSADSKSSKDNEKDMMEITIEQIRQVQNFLAYKSYNGGVKTVIMENAERMSVEAQNCFLKTLEEPKGQTLILLLSTKPEMMLPTIASRCQVINFLGNGAEAAKDAQLQNLLKILPADLAEKFKFTKTANLEGENLGKLLQGLEWHFRNLLLVNVGAAEGMPNKYSIQKLQHILLLIEKLSYQAATSNINQKLALEVLLLEI